MPTIGAFGGGSRRLGGDPVGRREQVLATITRIHAAGLDADKWPDALAAFADVVGGHGASLEFLERPTLRHRGMFSHGLPAVGDYVAHYASLCPRIPSALARPAGGVQYDAQHIDEMEMNRNPFYAEFLAAYDMRYYLGAVLAKSDDELVIAGVQIAPRQGHATAEKIRLMKLLAPHLRQAADVTRRLGALAADAARLAGALDWLADGVVTLGRDGRARHVNAAAQAILARNDGFALRQGCVEFAAAGAAARFGAALRAIARLRAGQAVAAANADFVAERPSGAPPLTISLRPAVASERGAAGGEDALAMLFVRDPSKRSGADADLLRRAFSLTPAEADVAEALRSGLSADDYARSRNVSPNTVYTHVQRIKTKTGCARLPALIRRLEDIRAGARVGRA
jgi:DNA-binding CsgD family transcriptional regulator